jgi:hypothetical protein
LIKAIRDLPEDDAARRQLEHTELRIRCQLEDSRGYDLRSWRPGLSATLRQRRRFGNLAAAGVTPDRIIAMVAGMYSARDVFQSYFLSDRQWLHQLGRSVAMLATLPKSTAVGPFGDEGLLSSVAVPMGEWLVDRVGTFAGALSATLQSGRGFGAVPALTAGMSPPSKSACRQAIARKQWRPRED